jgi:hypothetical protein
MARARALASALRRRPAWVSSARRGARSREHHRGVAVPRRGQLPDGRPVQLLDGEGMVGRGHALAALLPAEQRVERADDGAEPKRPVVGGDGGRGVGQDERDRVAGGHAALPQRAGHARSPLVQLGVAQGAAVADQRRPLRMPRRGVLEQAGERHRSRR